MSLEAEGAAIDAGVVIPADTTSYARLGAFSYLSRSADTPTYVAIMRVFTRSLLTDFASADVAARLADADIQIDVDAVEARLQALVEWGNLLPSPREIRVTSIADYQRQRARYQLSKLGSQVHEHAETILAATDGVQEITRELLGIVARSLHDLAETANVDGGVLAAATETVAEPVTTAFVAFSSFASQIRDFYASLGNVLARFDLDSDEYNGFKHVLLDYLEVVIDDTDRYSPRIEAALDRLDPHVDDIVAKLDDPRLLALAAPAAIGIERAPGRTRSDWDELRRWFDPANQLAGVRELRGATNRALSALLANLKRLNALSLGEGSHRRDLLRLATWFDQADPATAHALYDAAFSMHSARHFGGTPDNADVPATTSWWNGPVVDVPVSLREYGDRIIRGRNTPAADHSAQRNRLTAERAADTKRRRAAAAELLLAGDRLDHVRLSAAALGILTELLANALASASPTDHFSVGTAPDTGVLCTFQRQPGLTTVIRTMVGDVSVLDGRIMISAASAAPLAAVRARA